MAYTKQKKTHKLDIAKRIKQKMAELSYTQDDIETVIGATNQSVTRWLSGRTKPQSNNLASMAQLFDTTPEWLLYGDAATDSKDLSRDDTQDAQPTESATLDDNAANPADAHGDRLEDADAIPAEPQENILNISFATKDMTDTDEDEVGLIVLPVSHPHSHGDCHVDRTFDTDKDEHLNNFNDSLMSAMTTTHEVPKKTTKLKSKNKNKKKNKKKIYTMPFPADKDANKVTGWTSNVHGGATSEEDGYKSLVLARSINVVEGQVNSQALRLVLAAKRVKKAKKQADKLAKEAEKLMKSANKAERLSQKAAKKLEAEQASLDAAQIAGARVIILGE